MMEEADASKGDAQVVHEVVQAGQVAKTAQADEGVDAGSLESRWQHWRVSVRAEASGELVAEVPPENLLNVLGDARDADGPGFRRLVDLTAVDHGAEADSGRFEMIYWFSRPEGGAFLRVRVALGAYSSEAASETLEVDSIVGLWSSANWLEREVFDLFGISFRGHPDLRRLLLPSDFEGAPLRKDYPRQPNLPLPKLLEAHKANEANEANEAHDANEPVESLDEGDALESNEELEAGTL